ncbi:MAG: DUF1972 domain-containing protein [Blastomonas sp.]|nr:DUF1972 domain-containing protein [Blastomonas sp.]
MAGKGDTVTQSATNPRRSVNILGCRGVPAAHGGFETFAARLAPYLVQHGWDVTVYCQDDVQPGADMGFYDDEWQGVRRRHIPIARTGPVGTISFDLKATRDVLSRPGVDLVLGYNTAVFAALNRIKRRKVVMNMDGIEWKRAKWSAAAKAWFYLNERAGSYLSQVAIADHPSISDHLRSVSGIKSVVIPYGADLITGADAALLEPLGVTPNRYFVSIARIEPENSIFEIVQAFSLKPRNARLVVLGKLEDSNPYHQKVKAAASTEVDFPGAIYDADRLAALRFYTLAYMHGHQVGGTNPSLVEALGAGNPVIAHNNRFNLWTAGEGQFYFATVEECAAHMEHLLDHPAAADAARVAARARYARDFEWEKVLGQYRMLLEDVADGAPVKPAY